LIISDDDPEWLINTLVQTVSLLPHLTKLDFRTSDAIDYEPRFPFGIFVNLSELSVECGHHQHVSFFVPEMATAIANSPQLKRLEVYYTGFPPEGDPLPTLCDLFAKISTKNPLRLEHLSIGFMDATVDQATLPHLTHLTSFGFQVLEGNLHIAQSVWTSLLVHNIKLSDVEIGEIITEETMLYLSSFSGLKRLVVDAVEASSNETMKHLENILFTVVLPKHVDSLRTLEIFDFTLVENILSVLFSLTMSG
jgi:hypothetical protein